MRLPGLLRKLGVDRPWLIGLWLVALTFLVGAAQPGNQAGLVVRFSDDRVETYCVSFEEAEITGRELMERAGLALEFEEVGMGASVCRVEDVGCGSGNCFCQCQGGTCEYWSYWHLRDGEWRYATSGASITQVAHGEVQGWSWGPGSVSEAIAPPDVTFDEVCVTEEAAPEATPEGGESVAIGTVQETSQPVAADTSSDDGDGQAIPSSYLYFGLVVVALVVIAVMAGRRRQL